MFAPSIPGRIRTFAPSPDSKRSIHATAGLRSLTSAEHGRECICGFTLFELLIVMAVIAILMVLIAPAFTTIKGGTDVTSAAYTIKGVLDTARTYAKANNTYTWVGFFEEDVSKPWQPPTSLTPPGGVGRIIVSIVASKDGTMIYDATAPAKIDTTKLIQLGKLIKIENAHLAGDAAFTAAPSTPTGVTFGSRPSVTYRIATPPNSSPSDSRTPFQYPLGSPQPPAQYSFLKAVEFSPRGEARIDNSADYSLQNAAEIGLRGTRGTTVDTGPNVVAVQVGGVGGDVIIYRK
jgi:prepilin-type N-terminal cleavage/methylation domain-containing protein